MKDSKKLAITGANGYLGQHTIKAAIEKGWEVVGIVRREDVMKEVESLGARPFMVKNFDKKSLLDAFQGCKAVIHFANVVCGSKDLFEKVNVEGIQSVVDAALESNISRIIYPSGLGVDKYKKEEWAQNEYFRTKSIAEQVLFKGGVPYVIFRPSYILGPGDELIPEIIDQIIDGTVLIAGTGNIPMQPIYVKDATTAFLAAADGIGEDNKIYNLVGPRIINMNKLIEMVYQCILEMGISIPKAVNKMISFDAATKELGICQEMVDVMQCDITSDGNLTAQALGFKLSELEVAIEAAVHEKLSPNQSKMGKNAIILLSGGIDSATALFWAHNEGYNILAITFEYGFRPKNERKAALKQAEMLGIDIIEVPMEYIKQATDLRWEGFPVPSVVNAPEGYIPMRNIIFYSIASYFAEIYGCELIIGGHIADDPVKFPDVSDEYFAELEKLIKKGKHDKDKTSVKLLFPLLHKTKVEVIKLAKELEVPFELTWSCFTDNDVPCGLCHSCLERAEAFKKLNYKDPGFLIE
jgi:7-cyano-7-deazaguanine synthase